MNLKKTNRSRLILVTLAILAVALGVTRQPVHAGVLNSSDGAAEDQFGFSVSQSGTIGLVAAAYDDIGANIDQGSAYVFRNLDTAAGTVTQNVKLVASDGAANDFFGVSVSLSGTTGLVGAGLDDNVSTDRGAAYLFRNLDTATGTITQNAKLTASDGSMNDYFGYGVSLAGTTALVGAFGDNINGENARGSAYVFRNLDTASGTITQNAKLLASDGVADDWFGYSVSLSGTTGLIGAMVDDFGANGNQGSAYVFRNLHTATGTVTQNVKLVASDGAASDYFGVSVSLSGTIGLVGAQLDTIGANNFQGSAYVFRNLNTATGTVTQNLKLTASDGTEGDFFGYAVSLSGTTGLVGAIADDIESITNQGSVYIFRGLDTATGTATQNVKLFASDAGMFDRFGATVSLAGDAFTIGALGDASNTGWAYTGTVSSVTTLNVGSASRKIDGLSFISQDDWIIGQTTSGNVVNLLAGNTGNVTAASKRVYVGQNAGSNNNTLIIAGTLTASQINVGAASNTGNLLVVNGTLNGGSIVNVASGSTLAGNGTITGNVINDGLFTPGNPADAMTIGQGFSDVVFLLPPANSPGLMTVIGNVSGNGDYLMEIASILSYDQINATGSLSFAGSTIEVDLEGYTPVLGDSFDLFDFAGTAGGTWGFDFTQAPLNAGLMWDYSTFATTGVISVAAIPEPASFALLTFGGVALLVYRRRVIPGRASTNPEKKRGPLK